MAKIIVQHEEDPAIGIVLEEVLEPEPGRARGYHGKCTECGWPMHRWHREHAIDSAQRHVGKHESGL